MSLRFNVPFVPDREYAEQVNAWAPQVRSVHFGLYREGALDARIRLERRDVSELAGPLALLRGVRTYALLNSRFHHPELYGDTARLRGLVETLDALRERAGLTGVVYADPYLLRALSLAAPSTCRGLEAVPSVNCMLDGFHKVVAHLEAVAQTRFRQPGKLTLDRALNRDQARLEQVSARLRRAFPDLELELLANEGCLLHCPFKQAHDAHTALTNLDRDQAPSAALNRELGCTRMFHDRPALLFRSPFIRPEDVDKYAAHVDSIKVCGRTRGTGFLVRAVQAYLDRRWDGNLLELNDTMECLAGRVRVDNAALPEDFCHRLRSCQGTCEECGYCEALTRELVQYRSPGLPAMG